MKLDLSSQSAIVTGGARGIGRAIAEGLAGAGAQVHALDISLPDDRGHSGITFHKGDITDTKSIKALLTEIAKPVSILVNNAGITRDRTLLKMSKEEWGSVIDINLTGTFNMIAAVAPSMIAAGGGAIVNITSINAIRGKFGQGNYAAAKAGMIGLTKTAAREFGRKGITVNAIAPGMVLTDMALALPEEILDRARAETATGKLAEPADIANAVVFLASDAASMITGQVLNVDSGQLI
jgi:acetoacetyl-CoA reductase/3-oxoacyl-[acyl-carrier protein] reductase